MTERGKNDEKEKKMREIMRKREKLREIMRKKEKNEGKL